MHDLFDEVVVANIVYLGTFVSFRTSISLYSIVIDIIAILATFSL